MGFIIQSLVLLLSIYIALCAADEANSSYKSAIPKRSVQATDSNVLEIDATMPKYPTTKEDEYLCTTVNLPDRPMKLIGVEPLSDADYSSVHHILLFGCTGPSNKSKVWRCQTEPACAVQDHVLYGWARNAPILHLPDQTGYSVGPGTKATSLVLQVHYLQIRHSDDRSGVRLRLSEVPTPYSASILTYQAANFEIPPHEPKTSVPNECCYSGIRPLTGFAFRVHTHALGSYVYLETDVDENGVPLKNKTTGAAVYRKVADRDPQLPQGFTQVDKPFRIISGDKLKVTCDFNSTEIDHVVQSGHTATNEMCLLYLMHYSELPLSMWCSRDRPKIELRSAAGMDPNGSLIPEQEYWNPPTRLEANNTLGSVQVGQIAGIAAHPINDSSVWAFTRATRTWTGSTFDANNNITKKNPINWPVVLELDRETGSVMRSWGAGFFYMPHMITIDREGNVWTVDVGLHQVFKHMSDGRLLMTLGTRLQPGKGPSNFCQPTHVIISRDGSIYVADGYCNSRVVKFSPNGEYEREYVIPRGEDAPEPLPHSIAIDDCSNTLYVADREAGRVVAINVDDGKIIAVWAALPIKGYLPYGIRIGPFGAPIVVAWDRDGTDTTWIVALNPFHERGVHAAYQATGAVSPHDLELVPAPLALTGVGDRAMSVLVAETAPSNSRLRKYTVLLSEQALLDQEKDDSTALPEFIAAMSHAGHSMMSPTDNADEVDTSTAITKEEDDYINHSHTTNDNDWGIASPDEKNDVVIGRQKTNTNGPAATTVTKKPSKLSSKSSYNSPAYGIVILFGVVAVVGAGLMMKRSLAGRHRRGYSLVVHGGRASHLA